MGVNGRLVAPGGAGVDVQRGRLLVPAKRLDDLGPQQPRRAQLGHFHEEAPADGHVPVNGAGGGVGVEAALDQGAQSGHARRQPSGQLLGGVGPGVVVGVCADGGGGQARRVGGGPTGQVGHLVVSGVEGQRQRALFGQDAQRIGGHAAGQFVAGQTGVALAGDEEGQQRHGRRAAVGQQRDARQVDVAQRFARVAGCGQR